MPELPDIEIYKQYADATSLHKTIAHAHVKDEYLLAEDVSRQKIAQNLVGNRFEAAARHGKVLGLTTRDGGCLILHFGMTGNLKASDDSDEEADYTALLVEFDDDSTLAFTCKRRFATIGWSKDFKSHLESKELGPDALALDKNEFHDLVRAHRSGIKSLLMNQHRIAGIGNLYSDEMLFQARIAPDRKTPDLSDDEVDALFRSMRHVLQTSIEHRAEPQNLPDNWLAHHREDGADCPNCSGKIRQATVAGRSSYTCEECQT